MTNSFHQYCWRDSSTLCKVTMLFCPSLRLWAGTSRYVKIDKKWNGVFLPFGHTPATTHNVISVYCIILVYCGIGRKILLDLPRQLSTFRRDKKARLFICVMSRHDKKAHLYLACWGWYWPPKFLSRTGWDFTVQLNIVWEWQRQTVTNSPRSFYINKHNLDFALLYSDVL
jgi:hypothetical protein